MTQDESKSGRTPGDASGAEVIRAWSVYWQQDRLHACVPASDAASPADMTGVWRAFFAALAPGCRVLDIGTGNGAVVIEAVAASAMLPQPLEIHGVDLADIAPARFAQAAAGALSSVNFHPRTAMESLPFPERHFDAVSGQFALEYSRVSESVPEILRVLKPDGRFRFLLHADDGVLRARSRMQREQAQAILASPLFGQLDDMLGKLGAASARPADGTLLGLARDAIARVGATLAALEGAFAGAADRSLPDNLFAAIRQLIDERDRLDGDALRARAADIRQRLEAVATRLAAMEQAALDLDATEALAGMFRQGGAGEITIETARAGARSQPVGRWLYGRSAPAS